MLSDFPNDCLLSHALQNNNVTLLQQAATKTTKVSRDAIMPKSTIRREMIEYDPILLVLYIMCVQTNKINTGCTTTENIVQMLVPRV